MGRDVRFVTLSFPKRRKKQNNDLLACAFSFSSYDQTLVRFRGCVLASRLALVNGAPDAISSDFAEGAIAYKACAAVGAFILVL